MKTKRLLSISPKNSNNAVASTSSRIPDSFLDTFNSLPHLENVDPASLHENPRDRLKNEDYFDSIMNRCNLFPLHEAFEPILSKMFNTERVILWENRPESRDFHSKRLEKEISISNPIIDQIISKKKNCIIYDEIKDQQLAQQFATQPDSSQLFFSLVINNGLVIGIVQLTRSIKSTPSLFDVADEQKAKFIARKFSIYGSSPFSQPQIITYASELSHYGNLKVTADHIIKSIKMTFSCTTVDFWFFNEKMNMLSRYEKNSGFVNIYRCTSGIIGNVLKSGQKVNEINCKQNPNYNSTIDGDPEDPILIVTCKYDGKIWGCALRGPRTGYLVSYSGEDEKHLTILMPFIVRSLSYSANLSLPPPTPIDKVEDEIKKKLDSAALFSSSLDIKQLAENIEARFKSIIECESVRLLIVSKNQREFLSNDKNFPIHLGISGLTYSSQKASIYENPEDEKGFNSDIDSAKESIKSIKSLLSYPILITYFKNESSADSSPLSKPSVITGNRNHCIAVINFFNKLNDRQFNSSDVDTINSISHFCAHSIQNAISYQSVVGVTNHLRVFMRASKQVLQLSSAKNALKEILKCAKEMFSASRVTLFMKNLKGSEKPLYEFLNVDENENENQQKKQRTQNIRNAEEAINRKETVKIHFGPLFICTTPLFDQKMNILGAMEIAASDTKGQIEETTLIESFAMIAAISLERLKLEKLVEIGHVQSTFQKLLSVEERESYKTPKVLSETKNLFTFDFNVNDEKIDQFELIKIVYVAFDKFDIKNDFHITNQKLFLFLADISKTYKKTGFHTWKHAIDMLQFVVFVISSTSLQKTLEKYEILALIVASICHDGGHDDFQKLKIENDRSRIPFELLYRAQSVEEMKNVEFAIRTISKDECNLFSSLEYNVQKQIWRLIINLILGTSIRTHFKFMDSVNELFVDKKFGIANKKNRHFLMVLLMKCAVFSPLTRNFDIAQLSVDEIVQEFWLLGKSERCTGLKYYVDSNDHALNKGRSLPAILNSVVLPTFECFSSAINDSMSIVVDKLKDNIQKFTEITKEKYKDEEEKERKIEEERKRKEEEERKKKEEEERKKKEEEERKRKEEEERKRKEEEERRKKEEEERKRKEEEERKKREEEEMKKKEEERKQKEEEERIKKEEEERIKKEEEEARIKKENEEKNNINQNINKNEKSKEIEEEEEEKSEKSENDVRFAVDDEPASDEYDNCDDD